MNPLIHSRSLAVTASFIALSSAFAATETWVGNASANFNTAANWTGLNPVPIGGDTLSFGVAGTSGTTLNNDLIADTALTQFAYTALAPTYTINGNAIKAGGAIVSNLSGSLQTINLPLNLTSSPTISGNASVTLGGAMTEVATFGFRTITNNLTAGVLTISGGIALTGPGDATLRTWTFAGNATANTVVSGVIADGATAGCRLSIAFSSPSGLLTLTNANTYTGSTTVSLGTLKLDFSAVGAPLSNIINPVNTLFMSGGTVNLTGLSGGESAQTFGAVTFNPGFANAIRLTQNGAAALNLTLAGLTRNAGSSVDFTLPTSGTVTTTTTSNVGTNTLFTNGNGITYGTVDASTWATNSGGTIGALAEASYQTGDFISATGDTDVTTSFTNSLLTTNTLRFNTLAQTLTLNGSGPSTVTGGGILVTSAGTGSVIASGGGSAGLMGRPSVNNELMIHNYADLLVSAPIVDNGLNATLVTLAGRGTTTLSGPNTHSGRTTLTNGTLNVNATGALGTGAFSLFGGTLNNTSGAALTTGNSAVTWGGTFTFGTASSTSLNNLNLGPGAVTVTSGRTLNFAGTGTTLTMGTLTNTGSAGSTWTVNGLGNTLILGGYKITTAAGTAATSGNLAGIANINITGTIENGNGFANGVGITNTGTVTFGGTNTYTGATTLTNGTLSVGNAGNLGAAAANLVFNNGTLQITGTALTSFSGIGHIVSFTAARAVGLDISSAGHTFTADQVLNQTSGGLFKSGAGTLILNQTNTYTGATTISAGTLQIGNGTDSGSIATSAAITNNGALVYNVGSGNRTYGNVISGNGSLTQNSSSTLTISGVNTYTGDTTVNNGFLAVNGTSIANTNKLIINGGKVTPTGTEVVNTLFFGAVPQAPGTWGATGSGAINIDDARFSGTAGVVSVTSGGGAGGYASWNGANAGGQAPSLDFDLDGVSNGVEFFMNSPVGFTTNPALVETVGPVRKVTWTNGGNIPSTAYGTQYVVQTAPDLAIWTNVLVGDSNLSNLLGSVAYTLPAGVGKTFVRLSVSPD